MDFNTVGLNIRKLREKNHLRQEDLAEKIGMTANYIGLVERGERIPALPTFIDILNALGASADVVLADVLDDGYATKASLLGEKLSNLSPEDRRHIFNIIDTFIKKS